MKLRYLSDNWDYGTIGEEIKIGDKIFHVGDVCTILHRKNTTSHILVNKQEEDSEVRRAFFMGLGLLYPNEKILDIIKPFDSIMVGETYNSLTVCLD